MHLCFPLSCPNVRLAPQKGCPLRRMSQATARSCPCSPPCHLRGDAVQGSRGVELRTETSLLVGEDNEPLPARRDHRSNMSKCRPEGRPRETQRAQPARARRFACPNLPKIL